MRQDVGGRVHRRTGRGSDRAGGVVRSRVDDDELVYEAGVADQRGPHGAADGADRLLFVKGGEANGDVDASGESMFRDRLDAREGRFERAPREPRCRVGRVWSP